MKIKPKQKALIALISVLVVGIAVCVVINTDALHLMIPRESVDLNDSYEVLQAIDKEVYKYYLTGAYYNDTPEVRKEKIVAILEECEAEGLIEEGSICDVYPDSIGYRTATGGYVVIPYVERDPNHN